MNEVLTHIVPTPRALSGTSNHNDIENCLVVLSELILENNFDDLIDTFCNKLVGDAKTQGGRRARLILKALVNLYNQIPEKRTRRHYLVFREVLRYAARSGQMHRLEGFLSKSDSLIRETWKLSDQETRAFYLAVAKSYQEGSDEKSDDGARAKREYYLRKYVDMFESVSTPLETDPAVTDIKDAAATLVISALQSELRTCQGSSLLDLKAVDLLKSDDAYATLYELLRIFVCEDLTAYEEFYKENEAYLTRTLGEKNDDAMRENMRLLSLCSLASKSNKIDYDTVASALRVPSNCVEEYVLKAIAAELIDAKMDQLHERVLIRSAVQRSFGAQQWKDTQAKLRHWKSQLNAVEELRRRRGVATK